MAKLKNSANGVRVYGSSNQTKKEQGKIVYGTDLRTGKKGK